MASVRKLVSDHYDAVWNPLSESQNNDKLRLKLPYPFRLSLILVIHSSFQIPELQNYNNQV